jgi:hypothetical protein
MLLEQVPLQTRMKNQTHCLTHQSDQTRTHQKHSLLCLHQTQKKTHQMRYSEQQRSDQTQSRQKLCSEEPTMLTHLLQRLVLPELQPRLDQQQELLDTSSSSSPPGVLPALYTLPKY